MKQPCRLCWIHQEYEVQVVQTQGGHKKWKLDCLWFDQTFWGEPPGGHGGGNIITAGVLVDSCEVEKDLKKLEDTWMCNLGTLFTGLNSHNEVLSNRRRNYGMA